MMLPEQIISLILELFAGIGGIALVILIIWIFFPEKIEKWAVLLHKLLAFASENHERKYIAKHIETNITSWKKRLCKQCKSVLPYDVRIKWIDIENIESELEKETLIVKMKNHRNQSKNFAYAAYEYTRNACIPKARRYVDPIIMYGIDYVISKSILSGDTRALSYFADITEEEIFTKAELKQIVEELDIIHSQGSLTRILLSEYAGLSKLYPSDPDEEVHQETVDFEQKLFEFVTRKPGEDVDPRFNRKHIQAVIVPIARPLKLLTSGTQPHKRFIKRAIDEGINDIYVIAAGAFIPHAKELCEKIVNDFGLEKTSEDEYNGIYNQKKRRLYCACLKKI